MASFKCKCEYKEVNWESIRSKYERIQEVIVESYPRTSEEGKDSPNEESKNSPNLKIVDAFSSSLSMFSLLSRNLFRINTILRSY